MTEETKTELVDAVERCCVLTNEAGEREGWDYPLVIERLVELAEELRDLVETGQPLKLELHEEDHAWQSGLAQVLEEAIS